MFSSVILEPPAPVHLAVRRDSRATGHENSGEGRQGLEAGEAAGHGVNLYDIPTGEEALPLYTADSKPPAYIPAEFQWHPDPKTLAMYLFKFGFLFPPLWILGSMIMLVPIRWNVSVGSQRTLEKRGSVEHGERNLKSQRDSVERKWAKRCLAAWILCVFVGVSVGVAVWGGMKMMKKGGVGKEEE